MTHSPLRTVTLKPLWYGCVALWLLAVSLRVQAGVLPEDRGEVLYHSYEGGGVTVSGPSLLVRKKFGESVDVNATYDVDMVSSASIDVMSSASPYKEHRKQWSVGSEYLHGKTTYNASFLRSDEPDYLSDNLSFGISEDMFGDLTTVTLGFSRGWDNVKQHLHNKATGIDTYDSVGEMDRRSYRIGLSQIVTKKLIMTASYESISQDGYQQNPYRSIRYCTTPKNISFATLNNCTQTSTQAENYPRTRSSNAVGIDGRYYLPYRASIKAGYRYYTDTWGVRAHTGDLEYVHPIGTRWTLEGSVRYYTQTAANFYADLFPYADAQNFLARDKELASFNDIAFHIGADYRIPFSTKRAIILSGFYDRIQYSYDDFRNNLVKTTYITQQPLYSYGANLYQLQFSVLY